MAERTKRGELQQCEEDQKIQGQPTDEARQQAARQSGKGQTTRERSVDPADDPSKDQLDEHR